MFLFFDHKAYGILVPWPRIKPTPSALQGEFLTTGPPENSFSVILLSSCAWFVFTEVLLPGKSHGRRSLLGCSPWGCWVGHDWATSFWLFTFMHWRRKWQPTPVFLPGESQGWWSLVGCRLWGRTESDMTEGLHFDFSLSCIGEGNGNPLQYSCLENPRDGGAWWAAQSLWGRTESDTTEAT